MIDEHFYCDDAGCKKGVKLLDCEQGWSYLVCLPSIWDIKTSKTMNDESITQHRQTV